MQADAVAQGREAWGVKREAWGVKRRAWSVERGAWRVECRDGGMGMPFEVP